MARRRVAAPVRATGYVPAVLMEYAQTGGFWDNRAEVERWCEREGLGYPPDSFFAHPPGLRQWCIDAWATREGFVNQWGQVNCRKIQEMGIWRGYGRSGGMAARSYLYRREDLEAWRPISAPTTNN